MKSTRFLVLLLAALCVAAPLPALADGVDDDPRETETTAVPPPTSDLGDAAPSDRAPVAAEPAERSRAKAPAEDPPERAAFRPDPAADAPSYLEHYSRGFRLDPREFSFNQRYFWRRLLAPTGRDRSVGTGLLLGAVALAGEKRNIQDEFGESDTPQRKTFLKGVQRLGDQGVVPGIALAFYLGGATFGGYRAKETGYLLGQSALLTAILTGAGQWALNEDRPREGGDLHPFQGVGHGISGHASTAASIAGILSRMYLKIEPDDAPAVRGWKRVGKGFAYGLPILVGVARVNEQQHFAYNSLLGAGLGFWVSNVVADAHESYLGGGELRRWRPQSVGPIFDDEGHPGLGARWEF